MILTRAFAAWTALMDRREHPLAIALFRIAVGAVLLESLLSAVMGGVVGIIWVDKAHGGYVAFTNVPHLVRWLGGPTPNVIWGLVVATIAAGACVTAGAGGRLSAFAALQGYIALHRLNHHTSGSSDLLLTNALWILVLSRSTATLSVDCRLRTGSFRSSEPVPAFPRYLAVIQLLVMYWATGIQKVGASWLPTGSYAALYYILQQPTWQRFGMTWAARVYPLTQIATAMTWLWEVTAPLLFLFYYYRASPSSADGRAGGRKSLLRALAQRALRFDWRIPFIVTGVMLHIVIWGSMNVGHFSQITLAFYVCLFHPEELQRGIGALQARFARRPS